jgi:hypothetical protein
VLDNVPPVAGLHKRANQLFHTDRRGWNPGRVRLTLIHPLPLYLITRSVNFFCQIPRYIITLHELLAHTPPDHVEKKSLVHARMQLEDLSRQMHDEVRNNSVMNSCYLLKHISF